MKDRDTSKCQLSHAQPSCSSRSRRRLNDFFHLIMISTTVSLFINFVALSLRSSSLLCNTNFFSDEIKHDFFKCEIIEKSFREKSAHHLISHFNDPFEKEYSLQNSNTEKDELVLRMTSDLQSSFNDAEAIAAMNAAKRFRSVGNMKKAHTIMMHAFLLAPNHPDILTEYGIVLETADNNIVEAEGFYRRALAHDPYHTEALIRRARALPLVEEIDNRMLKEIYRKKDIFLNIPRSDSGLKRAMRESYFQHIYHTVALEGNSMSLIQTRSILETKIAVAGKSIIEHNEILGMDAALRFLNQSLSHIRELTVEHILSIHKRVLGFADPIAAGVIRNTQVYVGSFTPTVPELIMSELDELISWLNDEETLAIDPVELAALAHYKLVYIHPFIDGNGRTSRLLMNFILMQAGFPPVIINVKERLRYYSALKRANEGDLRPFIRFIAEETDRTLESFINSSTMMCDATDCLRSEHCNSNINSSGEDPPSVIAMP